MAVLFTTPTLWGQAKEVSFHRDVLPLLQQRCGVCHQGETAQKGFLVTSAASLLKGGESGPAVVAGAPSDSLLLEKVSGP